MFSHQYLTFIKLSQKLKVVFFSPFVYFVHTQKCEFWYVPLPPNASRCNIPDIYLFHLAVNYLFHTNTSLHWVTIFINHATPSLLLRCSLLHPYCTTFHNPFSTSIAVQTFASAYHTISPYMQTSLTFTFSPPVRTLTHPSLNCPSLPLSLRYCAVTSPLHYSMTITRGRSVRLIVGVWTLALLYALPQLLAHTHAHLHPASRLSACPSGKLKAFFSYS